MAVVSDENEVAYRPGGRIVLAPHNPGWAHDFVEESGAVSRALGDVIASIHHIGSTAVSGLLAKPIIDILAVVVNVDLLDSRTASFADLGYEAMGEFGIPGRRYFRKNTSAGVRVYQLHAFRNGSSEVERHIAFRDYLRAHPAHARRYAELKQTLAQRFTGDMDRYTEGKTEFIREIERAALSNGK